MLAYLLQVVSPLVQAAASAPVHTAAATASGEDQMPHGDRVRADRAVSAEVRRAQRG